MAAIKKARDRDNLALFMECGTGKTRTMIHILENIIAKEGPLRIVIFSPIVTLSNWRSEFVQYGDIQYECITVLNKSGAARTKALHRAVSYSQYLPSVIIVNYEALRNNDVFNNLYNWKPDVVICDESHRVKSHNSIQAKAVAILALQAKYRYIMTGTPITQDPRDLFMQFLILDKGATFGTKFWSFQARYFENVNAHWSGSKTFPKWEIRPGSEEDISQLVEAASVRVKKEECLDLPPLVKTEVRFDLDPSSRRIYNDLKNDYIAFVNTLDGQEKAIVAKLAMTKAVRLAQLTTGFCKSDDDTVITIKGAPRLAALGELLSDLCPANKVIVWACWRQNYDSIKSLCHKLGLGYAEVHGDISDKQSQVDSWRSDKGVSVMIANQRAAGVGINLIEAPYMIYFSKTWNWGDDEQSEARNYRGGSEIHEKVTRIDLVANDTVDELIDLGLSKKQNISYLILDSLKQGE